jgi:preprotein translocase subunit SecE
MAKTSPVQFFRQVAQEVSKVTWPTKKETWLTSVMVVTLVFIAAMFFFFVDMGLGYAVKLILGFGG